jgi:hypothetical protein
MKKMNFEQMEVINGGQTVANAYIDDVDLAKSCFRQGAVFLGSAIGTIASLGSGGLLTGLAVALTASAYVDYFMCQQAKMA